MGYYSALKKGGNSTTYNINEPGRQCAKWNKLDRGRQILHGITNMWNRKRKSWTHRECHGGFQRLGGGVQGVEEIGWSW